MIRRHSSILSHALLFACAGLFFFTAPAINRPAHLAYGGTIVFESSTLGTELGPSAPDAAISGSLISTTQSFGVRFFASQSVITETVGGHFGTTSSQGGMITASIIKLPLASSLPNEDGTTSSGNGPAVLLGTTISSFSLPSQGTSKNIVMPLSVSLEAGTNYALIFRMVSGTSGTVMDNNVSSEALLYFSSTGADDPPNESWTSFPVFAGPNSPYFFVTAVVPEPASALLAILSFAGLTLIRPRRGHRSRSR